MLSKSIPFGGCQKPMYHCLKGNRLFVIRERNDKDCHQVPNNSPCIRGNPDARVKIKIKFRIGVSSKMECFIKHQSSIK